MGEGDFQAIKGLGNTAFLGKINEYTYYLWSSDAKLRAPELKDHGVKVLEANMETDQAGPETL